MGPCTNPLHHFYRYFRNRKIIGEDSPQRRQEIRLHLAIEVKRNLPPAFFFTNVLQSLFNSPMFKGCQIKTNLDLVRTDFYSKVLLKSRGGIIAVGGTF